MRARRWIVGACAVAVALAVALWTLGGHRHLVAPEVPSGPGQGPPRAESPESLPHHADPAAARSPVSAPDKAKRAVLTVVDRVDLPVQGALVHVETSAGWSLAGTTGTDGRLSFPGGRGVVRHPDHLPSAFEVQAEGERVVVLESTGVIVGTVTGPGPDELAECVVLARERALRAETAVEAFEEDSPWLVRSSCRPDGSFRLTGVVPGRQYWVEGFLPGMGSEAETAVAGTAEDPGRVTLELVEVWGAKLVFTGPGGERLQCPDRIDLGRSKPAQHFVPVPPPGFHHARSIFGVPLRQLFGGVPEYGMADGRYRAYAAMTPDPGASSAPATVPFTMQLPGYEPMEGELLLRPLRGDASTTEFELTPRAQSFGGLDVEFRGTEYLDAFPPRVLGAEYELRLQERSGERIAVKYTVPLRGDEHLEGIPAGTYDVAFEGLGKSLNVVPEGSPVRIGPQATPRVSIDLGACGSIEVQPIRADGTLYDAGPIQVQLITETEPGLGTPMFYLASNPPYLIRHVVPGPHYLVLLTPAEVVYTNPDAVPLNTVFVTASEVTTVRIQLP